MGVPISHSRFRKEKGYDIPLFADEKWTVFGLLGKPTLPAKKIMLDLTKNWKRVIDSLYKGIMVIDTGGAIRHVNPALERLTGYRADELMGNTCTMLACSGCEPWYGRRDSGACCSAAGRP